MSGRDLFLVGMRLMGVWWLIDCASEVLYYVDRIKGYVSNSSSQSAFLAHAIMDLVIALILLTCGREITNLFSWSIEKESTKCPQCSREITAGAEKCPECGAVVQAK